MTTNAPAPQPIERPASPQALWDLVNADDTAPRQALRHLGQALVSHGLVTPEQLQAALQAQQQEVHAGRRHPLGQLLVESGALSQEQLRGVISAWLGQHTVDPALLPADPGALALVPRATAEQAQALPLMLRDDAVVVLMNDPWDKRVLDQLRFMTQRRVIPALAAPGTLMPAIQRAYRALQGNGQGGQRASARDLAVDLGSSGEAPLAERSDIVSESDNTLVRLVNSVIEEAIAQGASDIHIETEPAPRNVRIRLRVDGDLRPYLDLQARFRFALVARIKIMAGLDISEHRKPQDGKIDFSRFGGSKVELRVVTVPTHQGLEDVVLRVLASHKPLPLEQIGLSTDNLAQLRAAVHKSYGLILVCGPTGSGKTTTLHSVVREINTPARKIWTAENPIEITQEGLRQVEVNPRIGWTFAAAMRSFLRADPDVVMIGEMRDEETAGIAIEASLTGHLVLSTLHVTT
ncbi:MAG: Flp pilus assembly complex ATPase component TadA, partial [Comamonadaceae bacterium]|nr:Flp pilus assembly complex ATPase component TadA [Comamonadaceae bacterium]